MVCGVCVGGGGGPDSVVASYRDRHCTIGRVYDDYIYCGSSCEAVLEVVKHL